MSIRDYLAEKEAELVDQLEELRRKREPLEAELADVRRAKAALGPAPPTLLEGALRQRAADGSSFSDWTLKQMAVRALQDHFAAGATAQSLLAFFSTAYGRQIERSSLSPQLSRLKDEGIIALEGKLWKLAPAKRNEPPAQPGGGSLVEEDDDGGASSSELSSNSSPAARVEL